MQGLPSGHELRIFRCEAVTAEYLEAALSLRVVVYIERVPSSTRGEQEVATILAEALVIDFGSRMVHFRNICGRRRIVAGR